MKSVPGDRMTPTQLKHRTQKQPKYAHHEINEIKNEIKYRKKGGNTFVPGFDFDAGNGSDF